ncbi:protein of unknown function DUF177 [Halothece sp. PCC 7418]|nr:protein of unknown function DUF177 [Halothece sp. PCC 7418]
MIEPIYIPRLLKAPGKSEQLEINAFISGLETLTPVRGTLVVTHCGTYLEVSATAETIKTLVCDRSLQQYNQRLVVDTSELIWLKDDPELEWNQPKEVETPLEELTESLPAQGDFEPETWLYEQFCLQMPIRQLSSDSKVGEYNYSDPEPMDQRWAGLAALKEKLPDRSTEEEG